jgi:hypothetical protein
VAAHRHWRLYVTANGGSPYTSILELELLESVGGPDVTTPGMLATASSNYGAQVPAFAIEDTPLDASKYWESGGTSPPVWLAVDLGAGNAKDIRGLTLRASVWVNETPKDFALQWSDDGLAWTTVQSWAGEVGWSSGEFRAFSAVVTEIDSVVPASGPPAGGTPVTISGVGFTGATGVLFEGGFGAAAATDVVVVSDSEITCTAPPYIVGVVDVTVSGTGDTATLVGGFAYLDSFRIDSIAPAPVHVSGGELQVDGAGYVAGTVVLIAGAAAPTTVVSAGQLLVAAPPHAAGVVTLTVRLPSGETRSQNLTYEAASLESVEPAEARVGDALAVTGASLFPGALVVIGGVLAETTWVSDTELAAVVPALAPGVYDVEVENVAPGYAETLELAGALEVLEPIAALSGGPVIMYVVS